MPEGISPAKGIECELYAQAWHLLHECNAHHIHLENVSRYKP